MRQISIGTRLRCEVREQAPQDNICDRTGLCPPESDRFAQFVLGIFGNPFFDFFSPPELPDLPNFPGGLPSPQSPGKKPSQLDCATSLVQTQLASVGILSSLKQLDIAFDPVRGKITFRLRLAQPFSQIPHRGLRPDPLQASLRQGGTLGLELSNLPGQSLGDRFFFPFNANVRTLRGDVDLVSPASDIPPSRDLRFTPLGPAFMHGVADILGDKIRQLTGGQIGQVDPCSFIGQ